MRNPIDKTIAGVLAQATHIQQGAESVGETLGLKHMTSGVLLALLTDSHRSLGKYEAARKILRDHRQAVANKTDEARTFLMLSRDLLKPLFGNIYNREWSGTPLQNSLEVPYKPAQVCVLLSLWALFLQTHPELQFPETNITAVRAEELSQQTMDAIGAVDSQKAVVDQLLREKDVCFAALRKGLRDLINELKTLLSPTDGTWKAFGLNPPGGIQAPPAPQNVVVDTMDAECAVIKWDPAQRAEYYRTFVRVEGVDTELQPAGRSSATHFILQPLPVNAKLELAVSAVNAGGESARSKILVLDLKTQSANGDASGSVPATPPERRDLGGLIY